MLFACLLRGGAFLIRRQQNPYTCRMFSRFWSLCSSASMKKAGMVNAWALTAISFIRKYQHYQDVT